MIRALDLPVHCGTCVKSPQAGPDWLSDGDIKRRAAHQLAPPEDVAVHLEPHCTAPPTLSSMVAEHHLPSYGGMEPPVQPILYAHGTIYVSLHWFSRGETQEALTSHNLTAFLGPLASSLNSGAGAS